MSINFYNQFHKQTSIQKNLFIMIIGGISIGVYSNNAVAQNEKIKILDEITVEVEQLSEKQMMKQALNNTSGATNFIDFDDLKDSRKATNEDIFKFQPGVYAKSSGNEGTKISIRGSGINRAPGAHASGLYVMLDGIPFTGPGGTPYELLEPSWLDYAEVYRGANGFDQSGLALGGAINYVSKTGLNSKPLEINVEGGSRGYQKYQVSTANKIDNLDYYLSLNSSRYDGYQDQSEGKSHGLTANLGFEINPNLTTRLYLRYRETEHETPGRLTKTQINTQPTLANTYNLQYDTKRIQPGSLWLASKTNWILDNESDLEASFAYHRYPMDLQESPYRTDVKYSDLTAKFSYNTLYQLMNMASKFNISARSTTHRPDSGVIESLRFNYNDYDAGTITRKYTYRGSDNVITLLNENEIFPEMWLTTGISAIYTHRESEVYYPVTDQKLDITEWDIAPKIGITYQFNPNLQVYSNITKSIEPAHPWSMIWSSNKFFDQNSGPSAGRHRAPVPLRHQKANSFEIGARGDHVIGQWDLSYYYSKIKNELLSVEISPAPNLVVSESNASPTLHQGIEIGLKSSIYAFKNYGELNLIQSYTYSDFKYQHDKIFGSNQLTGIPEHYYQGKLSFDFNNGFFASINTEYASKKPVDYANTYFSDAYHLWGASFGYNDPNQKWSAWLDLKNITDEHYAATITPSYHDQGQDMARSNPGEGFSTYLGLSLKFD